MNLLLATATSPVEVIALALATFAAFLTPVVK
jgi:hypothetical protein